MTRPLMRLGIDQLEGMFAQNKQESQVLRQLAEELQYRQVPKAIALMNDVKAALRKMSRPPSFSTSSPATSAGEDDQQPQLWPQPMSLERFSEEKIADLESLLLLFVPPSDAIGNVSLRNLLSEQGWDDETYWAIRNRLIERGILETGRGRGGSVRRTSDGSKGPSPSTVVAPVPMPAPSAPTRPSVSSATSTTPKPLPTFPSMPLDDAHKVLRVAPGSAWESIESARRQLVQQASPARTTSLSPEKRLQIQDQARRANLACLSIWRTRIGSES